jgi:crossover junction endodeoxyribonuclease RusA
MLEARIRFVVDGVPRSQGSMTAVYNRKLGVARVRHVAAPALALWRGQCRLAAKEAGAVVWLGPIGMRISFGIKAPIDARHGYPKRPDLDKLVRGVLDALTGVCYGDDSQVTRLEAEKTFDPVTIIEVWRIERQSPKSTQAQATIW